MQFAKPPKLGSLLDENPEDEGARLRLCEEVKSRGKDAFQQKDMKTAERFYSKALSLLATMPGKQDAALFSNRAMVRLRLGNHHGALDDSNACLEMDVDFSKAYHRKALALLGLGRFDEAVSVAEAGKLNGLSSSVASEIIQKAHDEKAAVAERSVAQEPKRESFPTKPTMTVTVNMVSGMTFELEANPGDDAEKLKKKIQEHFEVHDFLSIHWRRFLLHNRPSWQLLLDGKILQNGTTLRELDVENGAVLQLMALPRGAELEASLLEVEQRIKEHKVVCKRELPFAERWQGCSECAELREQKEVLLAKHEAVQQDMWAEAAGLAKP